MREWMNMALPHIHEKAPASLPGKDGGGLVVTQSGRGVARCYMRRLTFSGDSLRSSRAANSDMV